MKSLSFAFVLKPGKDGFGQLTIYAMFLSQEMRKIKKFIMAEDTHKESNCFALTIICHGNDKGHLLDKNKALAWHTELFVRELSDVDILVGKPKIMVIQSCRGCECSILEVLMGKLNIMVIQSCRGCECLILEVLMGKPKIIVI